MHTSGVGKWETGEVSRKNMYALIENINASKNINASIKKIKGGREEGRKGHGVKKKRHQIIND